MRPSLRTIPWVAPMYEYVGKTAYIRADIVAERIQQAFLDGKKAEREELAWQRYGRFNLEAAE